MSKLKSKSQILNLKQNLESNKYIPSEIEKKWQEAWNKERIHSPNLDSAKKPFYNLMMFPYPSAEGMHVGNMYAFTGADVYGRFMRMNGYDVFEPIGLDGFGIHSENYAIKIGRHPKEQAKISQENFYRQLRATGNGFDWSRKVETYDPKYYKWTQWLFIQLFKAGLAYRKKAPVNFCPSCKTVLADEQVVKGQKNIGKTRHDVYSKETVILGRSAATTPESLRTLHDKGDSGRGSLARMTNEDISIDESQVCERCETEVEKKELEQWFFRITKYANRLLTNIAKLDWSEKVKIVQRQWIGRSEGARIRFRVILNSFQDLTRTEIPKQVRNDIEHIDVFTTRADTLFGATFLVLSPEHPLVTLLLKGEFEAARRPLAKLKSYVEEAKKKIEQERVAEGKEKTGVFTGFYAINPLSNEKIPVWIADYVLMEYGTGALFGDAHDERDVEFAKKYGIPLKVTVVTGDEEKDKRIKNFEECFTGYGTLIDSGEFSGLTSEDAIKKVVEVLVKKRSGRSETTYHLRDWLISRQRYWGPPIPMIYCGACAKKGNSGFTLTKKSSLKADSLDGWPDTLEGNISKQNKDVNDWNSAGWFPVPEKDLPILLPDVKDWKPTGTGKSPLANLDSFVNTKCPNCKGPAKRETDVSDTFLDSSWYFLRYLATDRNDIPFPISSNVILNSSLCHAEFISASRKTLKQVQGDILRVQHDIGERKRWLPVNMYIGGAEHSVLHLLYSRFVTMALHDLGLISFEEPFSRFYAHGLLIKEGFKMSKSKGNVVIPDQYIKKYGADTLRMYLMFLGPFIQGGDFYDTGIEGMFRFVKRVWTLICHSEFIPESHTRKNEMPNQAQPDRHDSQRVRVMHKTIKKVTGEISSLKYNTAIAALMEWYNYLKSKIKNQKSKITIEEAEVFLKLLAPFAPHMTEQLFQLLRSQRSKIKSQKFDSIHLQPWPKFDPKLLEEEQVTIVVQVNGKVRDTIRNQKSKIKNQKYVEDLARKRERVNKHLEGKSVKKVVYVEGKVINFVTQ